LIEHDVKRGQITSRFQPLQASHIPAARVQDRQIEQLLLRQRANGFLQRLADGGVQVGVGSGHFLRQGRVEAKKLARTSRVRTSGQVKGMMVFMFYLLYADGFAIGVRGKISAERDGPPHP